MRPSELSTAAAPLVAFYIRYPAPAGGPPVVHCAAKGAPRLSGLNTSSTCRGRYVPRYQESRRWRVVLFSTNSEMAHGYNLCSLPRELRRGRIIRSHNALVVCRRFCGSQAAGIWYSRTIWARASGALVRRCGNAACHPLASLGGSRRLVEQPWFSVNKSQHAYADHAALQGGEFSCDAAMLSLWTCAVHFYILMHTTYERTVLSLRPARPRWWLPPGLADARTGDFQS